MAENILLAVLGSGNIILFIKFLIERHDRKKERAEDKKERAEDKEQAAIKEELVKIKKDGIRTQLLLLILLRPNEETEILRLAEHYFKVLKGNWYMTTIFKGWLKEYSVAEPDWFDTDN